MQRTKADSPVALSLPSESRERTWVRLGAAAQKEGWPALDWTPATRGGLPGGRTGRRRNRFELWRRESWPRPPGRVAVLLFPSDGSCQLEFKLLSVLFSPVPKSSDWRATDSSV